MSLFAIYFRYYSICTIVARIVKFTLLMCDYIQEDSEGDDNWNIAMAGATCLEAMARTIEDSIVPLILPFVTQVSEPL